MGDIKAAAPTQRGTFAPLLRVGEDGNFLPLPGWVEWFIELGAIHASSAVADGCRRWTVVSVPDRRFGAALTAHGAVCARLQLLEHAPVFERFSRSAPGDMLTWIDSNNHSRFGKLLGVTPERISYLPRKHGGWGVKSSRGIEFAQSFWPANEDDQFTVRRPIADHAEFATAAVGLPAESFLSVSDIDTIIVGTLTEVQADLADAQFAAAGHIGSLADTVRPREVLPLGQHHRSALVAASASLDSVEGSTCHGPAIFDGAAGYLRLRDAVTAVTNVVILDRWLPRSEEAAAVAMMERNQTWVEGRTLPVPPPPPGIEIYGWTEEL